MRVLLTILLFFAALANAQTPRTLLEATHCSVEKKMLADEIRFPLRVGYSIDKHSFQNPEVFVVFLPLMTRNHGVVVGLAPERTAKGTTYYVNNNAGFVVHSKNIDFTPDAPLGGIATQAAITKGIRSSLRGKLYAFSRAQAEQKIPNLACISFGDPPNR